MMRPRTLLTLLLLLPACDADSGRSAKHGGVCGGAAVDGWLVVRQLTFGRAIDGVAEGFDLDGAVTGLGDPTGCGKPDYIDPDGNPGIDNALAGVLPFLDSTEAVALEPLVQANINGGEILLIFELTGLDSRTDDDCVGVRVLRGAGTPAVGTDGWLLTHQTFPLAEAQPMDRAMKGSIEDGILTVDGLTFDLPVQIFDADLLFAFGDSVLSVALDAELGGGVGNLGGGFPYAGVVETLLGVPIDSSLKEALPPLFAGLADLSPDEGGVCRDLSVTMQLELADAFVFE